MRHIFGLHVRVELLRNARRIVRENAMLPPHFDADHFCTTFTFIPTDGASVNPLG